MNPRVSRSSALASKATGFPIAKVAAKLAIGYTLDELKNEITGGATPASFEPTIDYVVTKVPRFTFEKFPQAADRLTTQMKSVGEVMAIGRTFQESLQKALRGLEIGIDGFNPDDEVDRDRGRLGQAQARAQDGRQPPALVRRRRVSPSGLTLEEVGELTAIDPLVPRADQRAHRDREAGRRATGPEALMPRRSCASSSAAASATGASPT